MIHDKEYRIADQLTTAIEKEPILSIAKTFDAFMADRIDTSALLLWGGIDTAKESVLDHLAYHLHVDEYDTSYPIDIKRRMIKQSITVHKHKGTPYAVKTAIATVYGSGQLEEWWDYGGTPYRFRVSGITDPLTGAADIRRLLTLINSAKNKRSWLDYVQFKRSTATENHIAMLKSTVKTIDVYPAAVEKIAPESTFYTAMAMTTTERLTLYIGGI